MIESVNTSQSIDLTCLTLQNDDRGRPLAPSSVASPHCRRSVGSSRFGSFPPLVRNSYNGRRGPSWQAGGHSGLVVVGLEELETWEGIAMVTQVAKVLAIA